MKAIDKRVLMKKKWQYEGTRHNMKSRHRKTMDEEGQTKKMKASNNIILIIVNYSVRSNNVANS